MKKELALVVLLVIAGALGWRAAAGPPGLDHAWPPVKGQPYPDLELEDAAGKPVRLSSLRGKVLLVEPVGIACPGCNAFAGGDEKGGFRGGSVQPGLGSLESLIERFAGVSLASEPDLVLVQLLLFDQRSTPGYAPTADEAREWAAHYGLAGRPNVVVLRGTTALADRASYAMVPGVQLVDRKGILRFDGSGHAPKDDPYGVVLHAIPELLAEPK